MVGALGPLVIFLFMALVVEAQTHQQLSLSPSEVQQVKDYLQAVESYTHSKPWIFNKEAVLSLPSAPAAISKISSATREIFTPSSEAELRAKLPSFDFQNASDDLRTALAQLALRDSFGSTRILMYLLFSQVPLQQRKKFEAGYMGSMANLWDSWVFEHKNGPLPEPLSLGARLGLIEAMISHHEDFPKAYELATPASPANRKIVERLIRHFELQADQLLTQKQTLQEKLGQPRPNGLFYTMEVVSFLDFMIRMLVSSDRMVDWRLNPLMVSSARYEQSSIQSSALRINPGVPNQLTSPQLPRTWSLRYWTGLIFATTNHSQTHDMGKFKSIEIFRAISARQAAQTELVLDLESSFQFMVPEKVVEKALQDPTSPEAIRWLSVVATDIVHTQRKSVDVASWSAKEVAGI